MPRHLRAGHHRAEHSPHLRITGRTTSFAGNAPQHISLVTALSIVLQISVLEQSRLAEFGGSLQFSAAAGDTDQLGGLMRCGAFTDTATAAIQVQSVLGAAVNCCISLQAAREVVPGAAGSCSTTRFAGLARDTAINIDVQLWFSSV